MSRSDSIVGAGPDPIPRGVWRLPFRRPDGARVLVAVDRRGVAIRESVYYDEEDEWLEVGRLRLALDRLDPTPGTPPNPDNKPKLRVV